MTDPTAYDRRQCPTRASGAHSLIAHWITPATCVERQRRNYHKCFSCQYRGLGANATLPNAPARPQPVAKSEAKPAQSAPKKKGARKKIADAT